MEGLVCDVQVTGPVAVDPSVMNTAADVAFVRIFNFVDDTAADTIMKRLTIQILLSLK